MCDGDVIFCFLEKLSKCNIIISDQVKNLSTKLQFLKRRVVGKEVIKLWSLNQVQIYSTNGHIENTNSQLSIKKLYPTGKVETIFKRMMKSFKVIADLEAVKLIFSGKERKMELVHTRE